MGIFTMLGITIHFKSKGLQKLLMILAGQTEINPVPRAVCSKCIMEIKRLPSTCIQMGNKRNQLKAKCKT